MNEPSFLAVEDILFIHEQEIQKAGGDFVIKSTFRRLQLMRKVVRQRKTA